MYRGADQTRDRCETTAGDYHSRVFGPYEEQAQSSISSFLILFGCYASRSQHIQKLNFLNCIRFFTQWSDSKFSFYPQKSRYFIYFYIFYSYFFRIFFQRDPFEKKSLYLFTLTGKAFYSAGFPFKHTILKCRQK